MKKLEVYVAHSYLQRKMIRDDLCIKIQGIGIATFNPFYNQDGSYREDRPEVKVMDSGTMEEYLKTVTTADKPEDIVTQDLEKIRSTDALVTYIEEASFGCAMEIFYCARWCKKPVFMWINNDFFAKHPWLVYLADVSHGAIVRTEEELLSVLSKWKKTEELYEDQ